MYICGNCRQNVSIGLLKNKTVTHFSLYESLVIN